ncbi:MAG: phosphodiesterase [Eubacteriales bacterium]|nr:phosphodiesterase [Eubacteriales bacterium]
MKWMIASDLHGSAYYTKKLLEAYRLEQADRLLLLGDLLYHGPRNDLPRDYAPKQVIELLNQHKQDIVAVRGNCEAEVDQMVLEFPVMADFCLFSGRKHMLLATHGHIYNVDNVPQLRSSDILLHGHTHIPALEQHAHCIYMNPGSMTLPKNGSHHGYMIWEDDCFYWKDAESGEEVQRFAYPDF